MPQIALGFMDTFVTEARLRQGLDETIGGLADRKQTGAFINLMISDIENEAICELETLEVPPARLRRKITTIDRHWLLEKSSAKE